MLGKRQTWKGLADIARTALASHAVCPLVLQSGGQVQRRTECEAAGRKKRHFFLMDAQLRVLPSQAGLSGQNRSTEGPDGVPPS